MAKSKPPSFQDKIGRLIAAVEATTAAELVVVWRSSSGAYAECPLAVGSAMAFLALSYFRFSPMDFDDWMIYAGTILAFVLGSLATAAFPPLLRVVAGRRRMAKSSEIMARACFQKGGLHLTRDRTGVLLFVSNLEQQVWILADRGVETAIPQAEWARTSKALASLFRHDTPQEALLAQLSDLGELFARYLPKVEDDINELPDHLEIDL